MAYPNPKKDTKKKTFFEKIGSLFTASKKKRPENKKSPYQKLQEKKKAKLKSEVGKQPSRIQDKEGNVKFAGGGDNKLRKYNKEIAKPKLRPKSIKPKKIAFEEDSETYTKKEGKMKPVVGTTKKKVPMKKKSKSNIANSSSYDAEFTKKGLEKRGLKAKNFMSKENYAKTTSAKNKKNAAGQDFGQKKKKVKAPMYESKGTMGGVKKSKYYSKGGTVFTGR